MQEYQVYIAVNVLAADESEAAAAGEALCELLGESWRTTSLGCVTDVVELTEDILVDTAEVL